jgi:glyoxylase-like metal-dependent hydrolase (beta-lactamase superfamily II)
MQEIASGVFVETSYEGVNVGAVLTEEGVVCIDVPSYPRDARDWVSRINRLHGRGARYLILTDYHGDRLLNTRWFGVPVIASRATAERLAAYDRRYPSALLESLSIRNPQLGRELTSGPVGQVDLSFAGEISLHSDRHILRLASRPGPDAGAIWAYLPEAGILFSGDSIVTTGHPPLNDMLLEDWLASLRSLKEHLFEVKLIVPGRGEPCGSEAASAMIAYLQLISSVVKDHIASGGDRQGLSYRVSDIVDYFPDADFTMEWSRREIARGLLRVYDQLQAAASIPLLEQ